MVSKLIYVTGKLIYVIDEIIYVTKEIISLADKLIQKRRKDKFTTCKESCDDENFLSPNGAIDL